MTEAPVGFIGLGVMGSAMSSHLLGAGIPVIGCDTDEERTRDHSLRGGDVATSPADVVGRCDIVVTSLPHPGALTAVLSGPDGVLAAKRSGVVLLETSTLDIAAKQAALRITEKAGVTLLDCPMSGTGQQARDGDLVAYLSGDDRAKVAAGPTLSLITRSVHDLGEFGNGTRMKLVANLLVAVHNMAAAEAMLLAHRAGLDLHQVLAAVGDGAGSSRMFEVRGPLMASRMFDDATMKVSTFQKDLGLIADFAGSLDSPTPLLAITATYYRAAAAQGRSQQDTACVYEVLRQLTAPGT